MFFWLFQPSLLNCGALLFKNLVKWSIPGKCSFQLVHHLCTCAWYVEYLHLHIWSRNLLLQKSSFIYVYVDTVISMVCLGSWKALFCAILFSWQNIQLSTLSVICEAMPGPNTEMFAPILHFLSPWWPSRVVKLLTWFTLLSPSCTYRQVVTQLSKLYM